MTAPALPLADIHMPEQVSFWPLAYGWWIVITLVVIILILTVRAILKRREQRLQRNFALAELKAINLNHHNAAQQINQILKRAAMVYHSREKIASLTGPSWKAFLLDSMGKKPAKFDDQWLDFGYAPNVDQQQIYQYHEFAQLWLQKALLSRFATQSAQNALKTTGAVQ